MATVQVFKCDACDHTEPQLDNELAPIGWLMLTLPYDEKVLIFCSWHCLYEKAQNQIQQEAF